MWGVCGSEGCGASVEVRDVGPCRAVPGLTRSHAATVLARWLVTAARRRRAKGLLQSIWERVVGGTHRAGVSADACSGCLFLDGGASEAWKDCSGGKQPQAAGRRSRKSHGARRKIDAGTSVGAQAVASRGNDDRAGDGAMGGSRQCGERGEGEGEGEGEVR
jgi:hypothetical protein